MSDQRLDPDALLLQLSKRSGVPIEQVRSLLQAQAELACEHAREGFPVPGLGVLKLFDFPGRTMVMRFGPDAGKEKTIAPKKRLKFWVSKEAKDVVFGNPAAMPNVFELEWFPADDVLPED